MSIAEDFSSIAKGLKQIQDEKAKHKVCTECYGVGWVYKNMMLYGVTLYEECPRCQNPLKKSKPI